MKTPPPLDVFDDGEFRRKLFTVPVTIVEKALLLYAILTDKDTPHWVRALVLAALLYLINPFDAVFDGVPILGYADDLAVIVLTLERISHYVTQKAKERAKALMPRYISSSNAKEGKAQKEIDNQPIAEGQSKQNKPRNSNQENEQGETNHDQEKESNDGSGKVPYIERFRILP